MNTVKPLFLIFFFVGLSLPNIILCQNEATNAGFSANPDEENFMEQVKVADYYIQRQNRGAAAPYILKARELLNKYGSPKQIDDVILAARVFGNAYQPMVGKIILKDALMDSKKLKINDYAEIRNLNARLTMQMGKYKEAEQLFLDDLEYAETNKIDTLVAISKSGLARLKGLARLYDEQTGYLKQSTEIAQQNGFRLIELANYFQLGDMYLSMNDYGNADLNFQKALFIAESVTDSMAMLLLISRKGWSKYLQKNYKDALSFYYLGFEIAMKLQNLSTAANIIGNIGTLYRDINRNDSAIVFYNRAIDLAVQVNDYYDLTWVYKDMFEMFQKANRFEPALNAHILYKDYSDSLEAQTYMRGLDQTRALYELEVKQQQNELLSIKIKQQRYIIFGTLGIGLLVSTILLLLFQQSRSKSFQKIAEIKRAMTELSQRNLRQQMNPHFIFNTLNSIQYAIYEQDTANVNEYLSIFSLLMRKTLENSLYPSITMQDEIDSIRLYLKLESIRFKERLSYDIVIDDEIDMVECRVPTMLIQPFVENALTHGLKHKSSQGRLLISLQPYNDNIRCIVEDNGIGRKAAEEICKNVHKKHNSLATSITRSRLDMLNELYGKKLKITIEDLFDSQSNAAGTRVVIIIPTFYQHENINNNY